MWKLDYKENWAPKNWCFWTVVLEKTLESPFHCKEVLPVHPKGDQSWVFIWRTDVDLLSLSHPHTHTSDFPSHTHLIHTHPCTHTHTPLSHPRTWMINAQAQPRSCWSHTWVLTNPPLKLPPIAGSSGQDEHIHRKSCFLCILTETALKGEMGIQRCQL